MENVSYYIISIFILIILLFGVFKKTNNYEAFVNGALEQMKEGINIFPFLLGMLVAVNTLRASGMLTDLIRSTSIPSEFLIQGVFRPVSNQAALSLMIDIVKTYGIDSKEGIASGILQGGSETTIYVLGVYLATTKVKKTKHLYEVGLLGNVIAFILSILLLLFIL